MSRAPHAHHVNSPRCACLGAGPADGPTRRSRLVLAEARAGDGRRQGRDRQGPLPRRRGARGAPRESRLLRGARSARSAGGCADDQGRDLPAVLHDQAVRVGGGHDARGGRPHPAQRSRLEAHSEARQSPGERPAIRSRHGQGRLRAGARGARDDDPGSAPPHLGAGLREHEPREGEGAVRKGGCRLEQGHAGRADRAPREGAARPPARNGVGVQHLDRRAGPRDRGGPPARPSGSFSRLASSCRSR